MSLDGGFIKTKQLCLNQNKEERENSTFDMLPNVAFRVSFGKTHLNTSKENNNIINHFPPSTSKTRGVWTVSLPYGVSQKPQSTNKPVNHIINTKEGKDKACEDLDSLVCYTISKVGGV